MQQNKSKFQLVHYYVQLRMLKQKSEQDVQKKKNRNRNTLYAPLISHIIIVALPIHRPISLMSSSPQRMTTTKGPPCSFVVTQFLTKSQVSASFSNSHPLCPNIHFLVSSSVCSLSPHFWTL